MSNGTNTTAGPDKLHGFDVTITETLEKIVTVEATDQSSAERIVNDGWANSEYVLDADNFTGVEFSAAPAGRGHIQEIKQDKEGGNDIVNTDNTNIAGSGDAGAPLYENQHVNGLLQTLRDSGRDTSAFAALLNHVSEMEGFVKRAEGTISEMKSQLAEMKEIQNHPVKNALQNAIKALEHKAAGIKARLVEIKGDVIGGCKDAVSAFKEKGVAALDKLASFFGVKDSLQEWKKNIESSIRTDDKAIAKIGSFANEYHSAGRAVRNMFRVAAGKQPVDTKKEAGKLAKTIAAPYKAQKAALTGLNKSIGKAIAKLGQLEGKAAAKRAEKSAESKKPSVLGQLRDNLATIELAKREHPVHERAKSKGVEI